MLSARIAAARVAAEAARDAAAAATRATQTRDDDSDGSLGEPGIAIGPESQEEDEGNEGHDISSDASSQSGDAPRSCPVAVPPPSSFMLRRHLSEPDEPALLSRQPFAETRWWSNPLLDSVHDVIVKMSGRGLLRNMTGLSACSGVCTEAWAAKSLGLPITFEASADCEAHTRQFLRLFHDDLSVKHSFESMACLEGASASGDCTIHSKFCLLDNTDGVDILVVGPPCTPYSRLRGSKLLPEQHPCFHTVFPPPEDDLENPYRLGSVLSVVRDRRPLGIILEQVVPFHSRFKTGRFSQQTPLEEFLAQLQEIPVSADDASPYYIACEAFALDAATWVDVSRPRTPRANFDTASR
jgi:hypothetical protein